MSRALAFVSRWFDQHTVDRVFEPLIADWQREWQNATAADRRMISVRWSLAFARSVAGCVLNGGGVMPRAVLIQTMLVLFVSTLLLLLFQIAINSASIPRDLPLEVRFWIALPMVLPMAIPLAMLPITMLARRVARVTSAAAAAMIAVAAVLAYVTAGWIAPALQGDFRSALYEQMYQRAELNDRAGVVSYPDTAVRRVRPTTAEERAAVRSRMQRDPQFIAQVAERTRPRLGLATIMVAALAVAIGAFGWALGGLGRSRIATAIGWWCFAWFALLILDGRFLYPGNVISQYIGRPPYWLPLAVFATAALTLTIAARRHESES